MTAKQRLFVGVALPDKVRALLVARVDEQRESLASVPSLRMIAAEQWHLTLHFLGGVAQDIVPGVHDACELAALATAPFELELSGAGAFRSERAASVMWIGVTRGSAEMAALAERVMTHCAALGFARESRAYAPHLTLARLKRPADVRAPLAALRMPPIGMPIVELTLFRSHVSAAGARYEALARYRLGSAQ